MDGTQKSKIYFAINRGPTYFEGFWVCRLCVERFINLIHNVKLQNVNVYYKQKPDKIIWQCGRMWRLYNNPIPKLREQDSNLWPLGYEPNELPTAPSRIVNIMDINYYSCFLTKKSLISNPGRETFAFSFAISKASDSRFAGMIYNFNRSFMVAVFQIWQFYEGIKLLSR